MCKIYTYEEAKLKFADIFSHVPVKLAELCSKLNIDVIGIKNNDSFCGSIKYNIEEKKFQIFVNVNHSYGRRRFTVAHELGHYFLHNDIVRIRAIEDKTLNRIRGTYNREETEANDIASRILMPKEQLLNNVKTDNKEEINISKLAEKYGVSEAAMGYRLTNLGVL